MIRIGAGVTYAEAFATLARRIPTLGPLFDRIGGEQVRNMGTIGGNIANGSPIGDTPPPLIALGATLTLRKGKSAAHDACSRTSSSPMASRTASRANSSRRSRCRCPAKGTHFAAYKITKRRDEDITAALGAFHLKLDKDGKVAGDPHRLWRHGGDAEAGARGRGGAGRQALDARRRSTRRSRPSRRTSRRSPTWRASADYRALAGAQSVAALLRRDQRHEAPLQVSRQAAA